MSHFMEAMPSNVTVPFDETPGHRSCMTMYILRASSRSVSQRRPSLAFLPTSEYEFVLFQFIPNVWFTLGRTSQNKHRTQPRGLLLPVSAVRLMMGNSSVAGISIRSRWVSEDRSIH
jgi:hypothetical protein